MHLVCVTDPTLTPITTQDNKTSPLPETDPSFLYEENTDITLTLQSNTTLTGKVKDVSADLLALDISGTITTLQRSAIVTVSKAPRAGETIFSFPPHHPSVTKAEPLVFECYYSLAEGVLSWEAGHSANYDRSSKASPLNLSLAVYIRNHSNFVYENAVVSLCDFTSSFESRPRRSSKFGSSSISKVKSSNSFNNNSYNVTNQVLSTHYRLSDPLTIDAKNEVKVTLLQQPIPPSHVHLKLLTSPPLDTCYEVGRVKLNEAWGKATVNGVTQTVLEVEVGGVHSIPSFVFGSLTFYEKYRSGGVSHTQYHSTSILVGGGNRVRIPLTYNTLAADAIEVSSRRTAFQKGPDFIREEHRITIENKEAIDAPPIIFQTAAFRHNVWNLDNASHPHVTSPADPTLFEFEVSVPLFQQEVITYAIRYNLTAPKVHAQPAPNVAAGAGTGGRESPVREKEKESKAPHSSRGGTGGFFSIFSSKQ